MLRIAGKGISLNYDNTIEEWRPVPDSFGYEVSNLGRVRSVDRTIHCKDDTLRLRRGVVLKPGLSGRKGHRARHLTVCIGRNTVLVHRLVALAFIGPCPPGKQVAHNDGVSTNNAATNLRYATAKENQGDMILHGTSQRGIKNVNNKLQPHQVKEIKSLLGGVTQRELAERYGVSQAAINYISVGRSWSWL